MRLVHLGTLCVTLLVALAGCGGDTSACGREVTARLYDKGRGCLEDFKKVGCVETGTSCPAATTYAVDGDGRCFWFRDLCVPSGFTRVSGEDSRCPSSTAPPSMCSL
jgi:hypothetical protein